MKTATYKVPGGKMLKVRLEIDGSKIKEIQLMGDFFLHPEEVLVELEDVLLGMEIDEVLLSSKIDSFLENRDATLIGATGLDIAKAIILAFES